MKRTVLILMFAMMAIVYSQAQQIAVVNESGETALYRTLQDAIEDAEGGSVIYLPGGGFTISKEVKITKKLTIIGVGYKVKGENADGCTTISGDLCFNGGSDGSMLTGCFVSGRTYIGEDADVHDLTLRKCYLSGITVKRSTCKGLVVNQNIIRYGSSFGGGEAFITNNIMYSVSYVTSGVIAHNNIVGIDSSSGSVPWSYIDDTEVTENIILEATNNPTTQGMASGNMNPNVVGDNPIVMGFVDWNQVFKNNAGAQPISNYHFTNDFKEYETQCGIYAGTSFDDDALPPVPYIVSHEIASKTDAAGKLSVNIRVKANE